MNKIDINIITNNEGTTSSNKQIVEFEKFLKNSKNFDQCFDKDGKIDFNKIKQLFNEDEISDESYKIDWLGKNYAHYLANEKQKQLITEDKIHNCKSENKNSENVYIQGDNLEVLKHLKNAYEKKIKMIYIDPPYNTGSDGFVYNDDRKFTKEELTEKLNLSEQEANKILEFTTKKSSSHSAWLTFMYPRLFVAKRLLKDDGVIFISIDDNEQAQLKLLCDEIFGEENFIDTFIWEKTYSPKNNNKFVSANHEYILCYSKDKIIKEVFNKLPRTEKADKFYKLDDHDGKGLYGLDNLTIGAAKGYDIHWNGKTYPEPPTVGWRYTEKRMYELIEEGRIYLPDDTTKRPRYKRYLSEVEGIISKTILPYSLVGHTDSAKKELNSLVGDNVFNYPKPVKLIELFLRLATDNITNDIILDFFSGSATTAHSVMKLNAEDNGNRKFVLVNIEEKIDKESNIQSYNFAINELGDEPIIPTIAKERIRRAAKKIREDNSDKEYINDIDFGFKVFKMIDQSRNYLDNLNELTDNEQIQFDLNIEYENIDSEYVDSLLTTYKLYDGSLATDNVNSQSIDTYEFYECNNIVYVINPYINKSIKEFVQYISSSQNNIQKIVVHVEYLSSNELNTLSDAIKHHNKIKSNNYINIEFRG